MRIDSRTIKDVCVLDCSGKIMLGEGTFLVRNAVDGILKSGGKKIVLNLADVNFIDNSGVNALVGAYTSVSNQGGQLKLLCLTKKINELLTIAKLLIVFQAYDSESAALASFT